MTAIPRLTLIAAVARNGVIGRRNAIPWHLPDDLRWFKEHTIGKPIVMGRRNFAAMNHKPLPKRLNIVLTRGPLAPLLGVTVVHSLDEAIAAAGDAPEIMVIGGAQIYALALPHARRILYTRIDADIAGDVFFPPIDWSEWHLADFRDHAADDRHAWPFRFETWERRTA